MPLITCMFNLLLRMLVIVLAALLGLSLAQAEPLCPTTVKQEPHKSEGLWPMPEEAFYELGARQALTKLNRLMEPDGISADSIAWGNSFVFIEGWLLKRQAIEAKKRGEDGHFVSDFCEFLKNRAYVHH